MLAPSNHPFAYLPYWARWIDMAVPSLVCISWCACLDQARNILRALRPLEKNPWVGNSRRSTQSRREQQLASMVLLWVQRKEPTSSRAVVVGMVRTGDKGIEQGRAVVSRGVRALCCAVSCTWQGQRINNVFWGHLTIHFAAPPPTAGWAGCVARPGKHKPTPQSLHSP